MHGNAVIAMHKVIPVYIVRRSFSLFIYACHMGLGVGRLARDIELTANYSFQIAYYSFQIAQFFQIALISN